MGAMKIRIVSRDGVQSEGTILRVMPTRIQVKSRDGFLHTINRKHGTPCGQKGNYSVHPEDVHLLAGLAEKEPPELDPRRCTGVADHWDV